MNMDKYQESLSNYLQRAKNFLQKDDEVILKYCALELRKAIELVIWKQFKDAFAQILFLKNGWLSFRFVIMLQDQSVGKMYKLLKKHIPDYVELAENGQVITYLPNYGLSEGGKMCYIYPSLPTKDYNYLSHILHYEKEIDTAEFKPNMKKLTIIYNRLYFMKMNYSYPMPCPERNRDKIIDDFKEMFNLSSDEL